MNLLRLCLALLFGALAASPIVAAESGLDAVPDYEGIKSTLSSLVTETSDKEAVIRVMFSQYENKSTVDYHVRKSGENWRIHDVVYPQGDSSLRGTLGMK